MQTSPSGKASASQCFCWHVPLTSLANQFSKLPHAGGLFSIHAPLVGWGRGDTAAYDACGLEGTTACVVRAREGGRDTIWLNGLFRGFAVYNVLAGKVTIG